GGHVAGVQKCALRMSGRGEVAMGNVRMSRLRAFAARVLGLFGPRKRDSDFDEEVQAHLQLLADRFVAQGMPREDADAAARRQFGDRKSVGGGSAVCES